MPGSARLPRSRRLARREEFDYVTKVRRCSRDDCFSVYANFNRSPYARLGITVARHVSPRAVARNRIKRQVRESFRRHQHLFAGVSLVVTAHRAADTKANSEIRTSLNMHWQRVAQLCKQSQPES
jgi:ribonuclease P protein component